MKSKVITIKKKSLFSFKSPPLNPPLFQNSLTHTIPSVMPVIGRAHLPTTFFKHLFCTFD